MGWKTLIALTLGLAVVFVTAGQMFLAQQHHRKHQHQHLALPHSLLTAAGRSRGAEDGASGANRVHARNGRPHQPRYPLFRHQRHPDHSNHPLPTNMQRPKKITRGPSSHHDVTRPWLTIFTILPDLSPLSSSQFSSPTALRHLQSQSKRTLLALLSWAVLGVEIIAFANEDTCQVVHIAFQQRTYYGMFTCRPILCRERGVPTLDCPFRDVKKRAKANTIMYSNSDVVYFPNLASTVHQIAGAFGDAFFAVGKRIDLTLQATSSFEDHFVAEAATCIEKNKECVHLLQAWQTTLPGALNHDRNGIDFMLFPRDLRFTVPKFMVGRIQWDQWLLLKMIVDPQVTTVEVSHVTLGLHMHHGTYKASHAKAGTDHNVELAQRLPHQRVHANDHVQMRGTVWLGRLDEVDVVAFAPDTWERWQCDAGMKGDIEGTRTRALPDGANSTAANDEEQAAVQRSAKLAIEDINQHPNLLRLPSWYFEGEVSKASGLREDYMTTTAETEEAQQLRFVPNKQSLDLLLFKAHSILHSQRFVLIYPIEDLAEVPASLVTACHADAFNHDVLFVTRDPSVWHWLTTLRLHVWHEPPSTSQTDTLTAVTAVVLQAVQLGYSVGVGRSHHLINTTQNAIFDSPDADVLIVQNDAQQPVFLFTKSRPRLHTLWLRLHGTLKSEGRARAKVTTGTPNVLTAITNALFTTAHLLGADPPDVRSTHAVVESPQDGCGLSALLRSAKFQHIADVLYASSAEHALDARSMAEVYRELSGQDICQTINAFNTHAPHLPHSLFIDQPQAVAAIQKYPTILRCRN
ncbi:hypothetical protein PTSG_11757 [Salpingoeca rosetta]|uniref:Uncharacterized protein n=1 Tax=Salpingoeca rosetta (strain ATCC 50818 / BSB-021) TaxID=946362 RepID=F2TYD1_SALR5|nr:uncharacterized protein PTSG_11757 [Salpingoeca rosetta]EGD78605.1 hypothetical protein PTSG_11757 [Salpingoeca rosetta]|eukprot:XP_004997563.1 hypothetical protein PTSG_11757 [Salpingoeca rosetta]